jgi:hypothetical protein
MLQYVADPKIALVAQPSQHPLVVLVPFVFCSQTSAAAAEAVLGQWCASGYPWFRLHPKGRGVVVARQGGVPAFTFVEEYFGELHTGECCSNATSAS